MNHILLALFNILLKDSCNRRKPFFTVPNQVPGSFDGQSFDWNMFSLRLRH